MKRFNKVLACAVLASLLVGCTTKTTPDTVDISITSTEVETRGVVKENNEQTSATLEVLIDPEKKRQTIDGFGAAYCWGVRDLLECKNKDEGIDLLFKDAGLSILRLKNEYDYGETRDPDVATTEEYAELIREASERIRKNYGEDITVVLSSWSPPEYLKSNGSTRGGTLKKESDRFMYREFALWWVESVKYYRENGIKVDYITIQNEPDFISDAYDTCYFGITEREDEPSIEVATRAVHAELGAAFGNDAPKILGFDVMGPGSAYVKTSHIDDCIYGISYHLYQSGTIDRQTNTVKPNSYTTDLMNIGKRTEGKTWQTEFSIGKGLETAELIYQCLSTGGSSAYLYWLGTRNISGGTGKEEHLVEVNGKNVEPASNYYAIRHFSEYVRPGYTCISTAQINTDIKGISFMSPDSKKIVSIFINKSGTEFPLNTEIKNIKKTTVSSVITTFDGTTRDVKDEWKEIDGEPIYLPSYSVTTIIYEVNHE